MTLPLCQIHSVEEFLVAFPEVKEIWVDSTERPIRRPRDPQKQETDLFRNKSIMWRALSFSDFRRVLNDLYIAQMGSLEKPWSLASKDLIARTRELAIEASLWFFGWFGLEILDSVVADIQEGLLKGTLQVNQL